MRSNYFLGTPGRKCWDNGLLVEGKYEEPMLFEIAENCKRLILQNQDVALAQILQRVSRYPKYRRITLAPFHEDDIRFEAEPNINDRQVVIFVERNQNELDSYKGSSIHVTIVVVPEAAESASVGNLIAQLYTEALGIIFKSCNPREFQWGPQAVGESDEAYRRWLNRLGTPQKNVAAELTLQDFLGYQPGRVQTALHIYLEAAALPRA